MDNTPAYGFGIFKYGILEYYFYDSKAADERWTINVIVQLYAVL